MALDILCRTAHKKSPWRRCKDRGGLGHLAAWQLPGGSIDPASRWAATSNAEVGQTTYRVTRGMAGREGSEGQSHKEVESKGGSGTGEEPGALR